MEEIATPDDDSSQTGGDGDLRRPDKSDRTAFEQAKRGAKPIESAAGLNESALGESFSVPGIQALAKLMVLNPFSGYLHFRGNNSGGHPTRTQRIADYEQEHRTLNAWCTVLDLIWLSVVSILILSAIAAIAGLTIYRTFISPAA